MKITKCFYQILYGFFAFGVLILIFLINNNLPKNHLATDPAEAKITYLEGQIVGLENNFFTVVQKNGKEIHFEADPDFLFNPYKKGDIVTIYKMETPEETVYDIVDYVHLNGLFFGFVCFSILTVWVAKRKGLFSILSLTFSTGLFYLIFLKGLEAGVSPLLACLLFVVSVSFLTIPLIHGFNRKSASSLLSINLGFGVSFVICLISKSLVNLGNVPSEALRNLNFQLPKIEIAEILLVILFMGAVGALIDVAVTISSAIFEAAKTQKKIDFQSSFKLGLEVGKDILGSMINTLLLAYLASSIPLFILMTYAKSIALTELLNYDFIALEIARTLIGATSLVLLVPLSAIISSWMLSRKP